MNRYNRLSIKYAVLFAVLLFSLTSLVLTLVGFLVLERTNQLRTELADSFLDLQSTSDTTRLRASGAYLSQRLFNPLYRFDVSALNEEIGHISNWLSAESVLILDVEGRVLTDGSLQNRPYGAQVALPDGLDPNAPVVLDTAEGEVLFFAIGYDDEILGFARIILSKQRNQAIARALSRQVQQAWSSYLQAFVAIAVASILLIAIVSFALAWRLSTSLSRPLTAMAHAAEQYAAGNLGHKLPDYSNDELGRLAHSLNKMAGDLEKAGILLTRAQELSAFGSWEWHRGGDGLILSHGVYQIFGVSPNDLRPTIPGLLAFASEEARERLADILQGRFQGEVACELPIRRADGETRTLLFKAEISPDERGELGGVLGTVQDVTEQRRVHEQLVFLANYDELTRLPNRNLFHDRLRQAVHKADRSGAEVALLFLDLDCFKSINDALGHDVGDALLRAVAKRLQAVVRTGDTLARMGGDEFTLIIEGDAGTLAPQRVAQKIIDALTRAFHISDRELFVSASVGIALYPRDAADINALIRNADAAMYLAKEQGKGGFSFFTPELDRRAHERLILEHALRQSIERREFELRYQPQVCIATGRVVALEALLRWRRDGELLPPDRFIPVLEETGLITGLTHWILHEACRALAYLRDHGMTGLRISVNLSAREFELEDLPARIETTLGEFSLRPEQLELEITENTLVERDQSRRNATRLAELGVRLAIDGFGSGYSSLNNLKRFHVDTLKIDRSYIRNICCDPEHAQITTTLVALARGLGIDSVAGGVEGIDQLECVRNSGCSMAQGYVISRPLAIDELLLWASRLPEPKSALVN